MSNFKFLEKQWPDLANLGYQGEAYFHTDSNASMIKTRMFGEKLIDYILASFNMEVDKFATQDDKIKLLRTTNINKSVPDLFDTIRRYGNKATHEGYTSKNDALECLVSIYKISTWFYMKITKDESIKPLVFNVSDIATPDLAINDNDKNKKLDQEEINAIKDKINNKNKTKNTTDNSSKEKVKHKTDTISKEDKDSTEDAKSNSKNTMSSDSEIKGNDSNMAKKSTTLDENSINESNKSSVKKDSELEQNLSTEDLSSQSDKNNIGDNIKKTTSTRNKKDSNKNNTKSKKTSTKGNSNNNDKEDTSDKDKKNTIKNNKHTEKHNNDSHPIKNNIVSKLVIPTKRILSENHKKISTKLKNFKADKLKGLINRVITKSKSCWANITNKINNMQFTKKILSYSKKKLCIIASLLIVLSSLFIIIFITSNTKENTSTKPVVKNDTSSKKTNNDEEKNNSDEVDTLEPKDTDSTTDSNTTDIGDNNNDTSTTNAITDDKYESIKSNINSIVANNFNRTSIKFSLAFKDLSREDTYSINSRKTVSAGTIKIFIMAEAFNEAQNGTLKLDDNITLTDNMKASGAGILRDRKAGETFTIKDLIDLMMLKNDNTATNILINKLGIDNINNYIKSLGCNDTELNRTMMDQNAINRGIQNYTSVNDLTLVLSKIYQKKCINEHYDALMLDILKNNKYDEKIPKLIPTTAPVFNKSGEYPSMENDAAIIVTDKGAYILCITTNNSTNKKEVKAIQNTSKEIYDEYIK
ncbi:serine hydrolase [Clostridium bornimense]|uniref:serine hydrolase n=1 Tax=Clostridium bornimense TaxID=1216932 RepID=UPI001C10A7C6|nr:serine hydrolase [Clostridium bornimense]